MLMLATVGRLTSRWSHLTADTEEELHEFAARIGLKRAWFQPQTYWPDTEATRASGKAGLVRRRGHYDVVESRRRAAIAAGAVPVRLGEEPWREKRRGTHLRERRNEHGPDGQVGADGPAGEEGVEW